MHSWSFFFTGLNSTSFFAYRLADGHFMALQGVPNVVAIVYDVYNSKLLFCSAYVNQH